MEGVTEASPKVTKEVLGTLPPALYYKGESCGSYAMSILTKLEFSLSYDIIPTFYWLPCMKGRTTSKLRERSHNSQPSQTDIMSWSKGSGSTQEYSQSTQGSDRMCLKA